MTNSEPQDHQDVSAAALLLTRLKWLAGGGITIAVMVLLSYAIRFGGRSSGEPEQWGQFGDYVGGILNPIFSAIALIALLATFALQVTALRLSIQELKTSADALSKQTASLSKQTFEATFFQLLRLHNEIVNAIDLVASDGRTTKGRDCFRVFLARLEKELRINAADQRYDNFVAHYEVFYIEHQHELGHYFRLLYNIVKLVDRTEDIDRRFYTNLVRAQLSSAELMLLFYNGISTWGCDKFKPFLERYALLKTIPTTTVPNDVLLHQYDPSAFGGAYPEPLL
jgi:uncharacterized membrane protein